LRENGRQQSWCRNVPTLFHCSAGNTCAQTLFQKLNSWSPQVFQRSHRYRLLGGGCWGERGGRQEQGEQGRRWCRLNADLGYDRQDMSREQEEAQLRVRKQGPEPKLPGGRHSAAAQLNGPPRRRGVARARGRLSSSARVFRSQALGSRDLTCWSAMACTCAATASEDLLRSVFLFYTPPHADRERGPALCSSGRRPDDV
jgi:hypothetical protein